MRELVALPVERVPPPALLPVERLLSTVAWHVQHPDPSACFWLFAVLCGFQGNLVDVNVIADKNSTRTDRMWMILEDDSVVKMWERAGDVVLVSGRSAYEHLSVLIGKWLERKWHQQTPCLSGWVFDERARGNGLTQRDDWYRRGHYTRLALSFR